MKKRRKKIACGDKKVNLMKIGSEKGNGKKVMKF